MEQADYFRSRQQGDLIRIRTGTLDQVYGIVSQTCDVVQPKRETIVLAPTTTSLTDAEKRGAADHSNPRYVTVEDHILDLGKIQFLEKEEVFGAEVVGGIDPEDHHAARSFALAVGRWFSRFAVPDELHPWLAPLQKLIRSKYARTSSPLHTVLQDLVEVRVEADQWFSEGRNLTVHTIAKSDVLPLNFSQLNPDSTVDSEQNHPRTPAALAEVMLRNNGGSDGSLWNEMAWAFADTCKLSQADSKNPELVDAVAEVGAELWSEDDFPLSRMRQSEQLDIDFLSDPQPL